MGESDAIRRYHEACKGICFLATCQGDRPRLRPMSALAVEGNVVWLAAEASSPKMAQIAADPHVELCYMDAEHNHLRLRGRAELCRDAAVKKRFWDGYPLMHRHFQGPEDPRYALIRIAVSEVLELASMSLGYRRTAM